MTATAYIVAARRTAIGTFGGALKDETPASLAALVTRAALDAAGVAPE
ncbi:acetyl-CoA C-acyltransferase, partial [Escherichia coli]|nr:acetyl-CoA C-acyltransferase [Escherichia coli]